MLTYTVELEPQKEGGYTVVVPALPGCISEGDTLDKALKNAKDAIEGYLFVMAKHKRKIPLEISDFRKVEIFKKASKKNRKLVCA
ncbi:MAG: type II toxin-antitoxin system HicB family antitoxin [Candidatus Paceibacterota bacterium]